MPTATDGNQPRAWTYALEDYISDLRFTPDGAWVAAASTAGPIAVLDGRTGQEVRLLPGHAGGTLSLSWSPDGQVLASGGQDCTLQLATFTGRKKASVIPVPNRKWVEHVAWSPDGRTIAAAAGRVVYFFDRDGALIGAVEKHGSTVSSLVWLPGEAGLISASYGGLNLLSPGNLEPVRQFEWKGSILSVVASPDGRYLATGNQDATMHLWRMKDGGELQMHGYPTKVRTLAFSLDSKHLASGAGEAVIIWDLRGKGPAGSQPRILQGHSAPVTGLVFLDTTGLLLSSSEDGTLTAWTLQGPERPKATLDMKFPLVRLAATATRGVAAGSRLGHVTGFQF